MTGLMTRSATPTPTTETRFAARPKTPLIIDEITSTPRSARSKELKKSGVSNAANSAAVRGARGAVAGRRPHARAHRTRLFRRNKPRGLPPPPDHEAGNNPRQNRGQRAVGRHRAENDAHPPPPREYAPCGGQARHEL